MSEPAPDPQTESGDDLLADLADDLLRRCRAGEQPSIDEYTGRHPTLSARILELFPVMLAMEQPASEATFDFAPSAERVGAVIGRYKLLERIGEGGFGMVYMAEQQHPVRRKVALKVVKPGADTRQVIARFEAERQALALMDHEHIAKVLDAGATESGRPYFVMELVHGVPITEFCDKNELPTRERLELFIQVCRAVQHAHTKGIIHRDIKPTNVLVTLHEGQAVPKVIDFGVAKATGQQLTEKTLFTQFAQMVGTPLYMSPEQAEMTCIDVDTRSDVYSLGVLLYELLTGTTPLDKEWIRRSAFDEIRRIIREQDPPRPSTRLSTMGEQGRSIIAAHRRSDAKQLGRLMRGELDWIVMKALEKERTRRYESVSALARDVDRYLRDEPVEACPPSAWYRFRKFARRRKAGLAAILGIALMVLVAAGILAVSNVHVSEALKRERRNSYAERIALANREWAANNLSGVEDLLAGCPEDLRGWEWHYLKRLRFSTPRSLRHESPVLAVAVSPDPDGRYLATATQSGMLRLWQAKSGQELCKWQAYNQDASTVQFSPDGRYLAAGSADKTVKVWELDKVIEGKVTDPLLYREHAERVSSVAFSPDGAYLASAGGREALETGELKIWDLNSGQVLLQRNLSGAVRCVQFSPDGRRIATCGQDKVQLWDAQAGLEQLTLSNQNEAFREAAFAQLAFSPDGSRLAAVGGIIFMHPDREVKVWDAHTGGQIFSLSGHVGGLRTVAFSPDGRRIASAGIDQTIRLWDAATGQEVLTLRGHFDNVTCLAFSANSHQLASAGADNTVRIWDATPLEREPTPEYLTLRGHEGAVTDVAFHPTDGRSLVSAGMDGTIRRWDMRSGKQIDIQHGAPSHVGVKAAYSGDGRRLATVSTLRREPVRLWDVATRNIGEFLGRPTGVMNCLALSPDGAHVASAGNDNTVWVWEVATGRELRALTDHSWPVWGVAFSPDGRLLASASGDNSVRIYDWTTGAEMPAERPQDAGRATSVAFSCDGEVLASGSWDRTIKFWDCETWLLKEELSDPSGAVLSLAFSRDGRLAWGSTDSTLKVWDGSGTEPHLLRGHTSWVPAVAFSPDGDWIASASLDGTVKIWRTPLRRGTSVGGIVYNPNREVRNAETKPNKRGQDKIGFPKPGVVE